MKKVLVACCADPRSDPRPHRMIAWLRDKYDVTVAGTPDSSDRLAIEGLVTWPIRTPPTPAPAPRATLWRRVAGKLERTFGLGPRGVDRAIGLRSGGCERIMWEEVRQYGRLGELLAAEDFDLIVSHDLWLLPIIFEGRKQASVLLDAAEFYPRNYADQWRWRLLHGPLNHYLCKTYLPRCDKIITPCVGYSDEYRRCYGVDSGVLMSLPYPHDLRPSPVAERAIRIIHHGIASPSRRIETMIEMMDVSDERFSLDLMLVPSPSKYWDMLVRMAEARSNVRIIPSVPMPEIIPVANAYDIGLFLLRPTNFNLKHTLPNKLFEFIQSRLAVAIGPSPGMRGIVEEYGCGIVSPDFRPATLGRELNRLTPERLTQYKERSHAAAGELNADANRVRALDLVRGLIGE